MERLTDEGLPLPMKQIRIGIEMRTRETPLSRREFEILEQVLGGRSNDEIARVLGISHHTVKNHIYHIFQKTGASNRWELFLTTMKAV